MRVNVGSGGFQDLGDILDLPGGVGTGSIELDPPILVLDTSRIAAMRSGAGQGTGFVTHRLTQTHGVAGDLSTNADVYPDIVANLGSVDRLRAWLIDVTTIIDTAGSIDEVQVGVQYPTIGGTFAGELFDVLHSTTFSSVPLVGAAGFIPAIPTFKTNALPLFLPFGPTTALLSGSNSNLIGAAIVHHDFLLWIGAKGALPPGIA